MGCRLNRVDALRLSWALRGRWHAGPSGHSWRPVQSPMLSSHWDSLRLAAAPRYPPRLQLRPKPHSCLWPPTRVSTFGTAPRTKHAIANLLPGLPSQPQLMVVACLPIILQPATFELTEHGFINVHPSLLPAFRGPQPAFWQLHAGCVRGGVSVHQMDAGVDTGKLLLQSTLDLEPGITEQALDLLAGRAAGTLLAPHLANWPPAPQVVACETPASYQRAPDPSAYRIDARSWSADRALRFIRGTSWRGVTFEVTGENLVRTHRPGAGTAQGATRGTRSGRGSHLRTAIRRRNAYRARRTTHGRVNKCTKRNPWQAAELSQG